VLAPDGSIHPSGGPGEIVARGPMLFHGYLDPADNEGVFVEGWFRTGDQGTITEQGLLKVTGRLKDIIIRKGENISAKEVEDVLHLHPAVGDVAAIALPDPERGELCCVVVVLRRGFDQLTVQEVGTHCAEHRLARYKVPERIEIVAAIPRNATGKALKSELVERYRVASSGARLR
jgi:cyclohexanecarboxylate-CoA ligase